MRDEKKAIKFLQEYKAEIIKYKEFAEVVKFIIETLLKNIEFKYQTVSCREKSAESLERKLKENKGVCCTNPLQ